MDKNHKKRVFVLGIDALNPRLLRYLIDKGELPNFKKILNQGGFSRALSIIPVQTPENWTTIATGAFPGTHGIAVWGRHFLYEPVVEKHGNEAMSSNLCRAEYIWEAAARQGLRTVLYYFVGYPPTIQDVIFIDWFWHPNRYYFELSPNACYVNYDIGSNEKNVIKITFKKNKREHKVYKTRIEIPVRGTNVRLQYDLDLICDGEEGHTTLYLRKKNDTSTDKTIKLKVGDWSKWIFERLNIEGSERIISYRFKLIELSKDGSRFKLYRTPIYSVEGFTWPEKLSRELVEKFGPYINDSIDKLFLNNIVDSKTFIEDAEYRINWISNSVFYAMEKFSASLFMMHWHLIDKLQHRYLGLIDPYGSFYEEDKSVKGWEIVKITYKVTDKLVGAFMEKMNENDYLIVVSDHGHVPNRKIYSVVKALADKKLVKLIKVDDNYVVDWKNSKVFIDLTNVYVNLKSRYKNGIVDDEEYEAIRDLVLETLQNLRDDDGEKVIHIVLKREDASILGLWGDPVGDIVFVYSKGFSWGNNYFEGTKIVGGANHGPQPPTAETLYSSNYATFMIMGPDIKKGYIHNEDFLGPVFLTDIAPTISYILGINPPWHSQGKILYYFFEGWKTDEMTRSRKPLKFPEPITEFIGDVTDQ